MKVGKDEPLEKELLNQIKSHLAGSQTADHVLILVSGFSGFLSSVVGILVYHLKAVVRHIEKEHDAEVKERSSDVSEVKDSIKDIYSRVNAMVDLVCRMKGEHDRNHRD